MITVFGSVNLDLIYALDRLPAPGQTVHSLNAMTMPGGKGANQALAARRFGADVAMIGAIGQDAAGREATALLRQAGVDLGRVAELTDALTGTAVVMVDGDGENSIVLSEGANARVSADQWDGGPACTYLLLQMEVPARQVEQVIAAAAARGVKPILNLAPALPLSEEALRSCYLIVVNESEAEFLAGHLGCVATAASLSDRLAVGVMRTLGSEGAELSLAGQHIHCPAFKVDVADTTAAGDTYVGVLTAALDAGSDLADAMRYASAAAAITCTRKGSQGGIPTHDEIDAFLARVP